MSWSPALDNRRTEVIKVKFSMRECMSWPSRSTCIRSRKRYQQRMLTIRPKDLFLALKARREQEHT